jgi:hypothetical protein
MVAGGRQAILATFVGLSGLSPNPPVARTGAVLLRRNEDGTCMKGCLVTEAGSSARVGIVDNDGKLAARKI